MQRVEWTERSQFGGGIRIIADRTATGCEFSDQEPFETRWHPRVATQELIDKAESKAHAAAE